MNTYQKEEKFLKASLKKRISFNLQTLIKFLITGVVAVSVTACGGGGGGSSSSAGGSNAITNTVTVNTGESYTTDKDISVTSANAIGIIGNNSDITNTKTIRILNQNNKIKNLSVDSEILSKIKELGVGAGIFVEKGTVTNKGDILLSGNNAAGIIGAYSEVINDKNIKTEGTTENMIGILSLGSNVINNGTIDINSLEGTGIYVYNDIKVEGIPVGNGDPINITNNGDIKVTGEDVEGIYIEGENVKVLNNGDIIINTNSNSIENESIGIKIVGNNNTAENKGTISINGKLHVNTQEVTSDIIIGMKADGVNEIINNGKIEMTHTVDLINPYDNIDIEPEHDTAVGMYATNGSTAINNKEIIGKGAVTGMRGENGSTIKNNGTITMESIKYDGKYEIEDGVYTKEIPTYIVGMEGTGINTIVKNEKNGEINLIGEGAALKVKDGAEGSNAGTINLTSLSQNVTTEGGEELYNSYLKGLDIRGGSVGTNEETGIININGNGVGLKIREDGIGYNYGEINISSKGDGIGIETTGNGYAENHGDINIYTNSDGIRILGSLANASNYKNINITGEKASGIAVYDGGKGINEETGVIEVNANAEGVTTLGEDSVGENKGTIYVNGELHVDKINVISDTGIGMKADGLNEIINNGKIEMVHTVDLINPYDNIDIEPEHDTAVGMYATNGSTAINNKEIIGKGAVTGMRGENGSTIKNNGTITMESIKYDGKYEIEDGVYTKEIFSFIEGMTGKGYETKVENSEAGIIIIKGEGVGLRASDGAEGSNAGTITLISQAIETEGAAEERYSYLKGLDARRGSTVTNEETGIININGNAAGLKIREDGIGYNYGQINVNSKDYAIGIETSGNGYAENHGDIILKNINSTGIKVRDESYTKNYGNIFALNNGIGIKGVGSLSKASNFGTITAIGEDAIGMAAYNGSTVINEESGIINVGTGALGMEASDSGSKVVNYGTIEVAADAEGGMRAWNGGTVANYGTIIIDADHQTSGNTTGMSKEQVAIYASKDAYLENKGNIITNGDVSIEAGGTYTIGTNSDGTFGKLTASNIDLNGNLLISTDMVKGSYEESYKLDNMIEGENINLGKEYKNLSNSLLYDAKTSKDKEGNLDGELVRNDNSISDFTSDNLTQVGELFDKYLAKENYGTLSQEDKKLVDKIFASTSSANEIKNVMNNLVGPEHLNISRQIFDIKDSFRKYDTSIISTLDRYDYNFTLIGEYGDIQSKDGVVGYDTKMTGFNGAMKLGDNLYGALGYGYSDIDYDNSSEGKIQTIHGAIYKDYSYNKSNIRVGAFGEYNFHETDRENSDGYLNTDYNSYLVGVTGEISKKYGDTLYIQPRLALDAVYGNVENFSEKSLEIKEQDYTSILPKAELIVGKKLNNIGLFAKSSYSYELGNLDKDMDIKLLNNTVGIDNDTMDKGNLDLSIGTEFNFESLSLNAELGKEFGKRDREYIKAGIIYKF